MIPGSLGHGGRRCTNTSISPKPQGIHSPRRGKMQEKWGVKGGKETVMASKNPTTNKPRYQQQFCSLHCIGIMPRTCFKQKIWRMTASLITAGLFIKCEVILKCRLSPPQSLDGVELVTCSLSFQISKLPLVPSLGELPPGICQVQKHIQTCIQHLYT